MQGAGVLARVFLAMSTAAVPTGGASGPAASGFRVRITRRALAAAVGDAVAGASRRLGRHACAAVFADFTDGSGRTLQAGLDALGLSGAEYLERIGFYDGLGVSSCQARGVVAVTAPGSRSVWVCDKFTLVQRRDPGLAEAILLHETLHSLGLGENPPTTFQITDRVVRRCGR